MGRTAYISLYIRIVHVLCIRCVILLHNTMSVNTYSMLSSTLLFLAVGDAVHIGLFQASSDARLYQCDLGVDVSPDSRNSSHHLIT